MNETTRVIALDAAGTIMEPAPAVHHAYAAVAKQFGFTLDATHIKQRFPQAMARYFPLAWDADTARTDQEKQWKSWRGLVAEVLVEIPEPKLEAVFSALWEHFRQPQHWHVYDDVEPTLKRLKAQGYTLCVVSNFDQRLYDIAEGTASLSAVDHWFASVDVGYQKPCVDFFRYVEKHLGVPSHQIMMIGDSYEADYQGALNAQWQALWLQRDTTAPQSSDHIIRSLLDLASRY